MSFPSWVDQHRKPKTEIRFLNGYYYVYSISYKYSPKLKRSKKITGQLLGKITQEDGFIQSEKDKLRNETPGKIHVAEFGPHNLFIAHMEKELGYLAESFANTKIEWKQIAAAAMMRWIYQSPIKMMDFHWHNSYYETEWKMSISDKQISQMLRQLGDSRDQILDYFSHFPIEGEHLLIDTTSIPSKSELMDSVRTGYSRDMMFTPQTNLFYIFSTKLKMPVYYRVVPGNIRDVKSFALSLQESKISDAVIVADKGFHSRDNIELLKEASLKFVVPLRRSSSLIDYQPIKKGSKEEMTDYFEFDGRFIWYYEKKAEEERVVIFYDEKLKVQEENDYLQRISTHPEEYSKEVFFQKQFEFGTLSCITNLTDSADKIYQIYKSRGQIEQVFDTYKNFLEADRTYMQNEKALYGWSFINFIAIQAYYKLYQHMKSNKILRKYSVEDVMHFAFKKKKLRIGNSWTFSEITKKHEETFILALPLTQ